MSSEQSKLDRQQLRIEQTLIIHQVDNAIALFDSAERLVLFNQPLAQIWGLAPHQLEEQPRWEELLPAVATAGYWSETQCQQLKQVLEQVGTTPVSYEFSPRDEHCLEVCITATPEGGRLLVFRDGNPAGRNGSSRQPERISNSPPRPLNGQKHSSQIAYSDTQRSKTASHALHRQQNLISNSTPTSLTTEVKWLTFLLGSLQQAHTELEQRADQLALANQEFQNALEELQVAQEELRQQNEQLAIARASAEQERQRYQDLFNFAPDGYLVTDASGKIQEANQATAALFGVNPDYLVGQPLSLFIPTQERKTFRAQLNQLTKRPYVQTWELNLQPRRGQPFPAAVRVTTVHNAQGQLVGFRWLIRDMTDRKLAEEALRQSEQRFRAIFESATFGIGLRDLSGHTIESNPALQTMFGYSHDEFCQLAFTDFTHPDDVTVDDTLHQEVLTGKLNHYQLEKRFMRKDGQLVWGRLNVCLVRDSQEQPQFTFGMVEDITERKRAEEALRESEQKFRAIFERAAIGIVLKNLQGQLMESNPTFQQMFGYTSKELHGMSLMDYTYPEDIPADLELFQELVAGRLDQYQMEKRYIRKDGQLVWGHLTVSLVRNDQGEPQFCFGMIQDITQRKLAEAALAASEAKWRSLIQNSSDMVSIETPDSTIEYVSPSVTSILGYQPEELLGKLGIDFVHPDDAVHVMEAFKRLVSQPLTISSLEYRFRHKDGSWRFLESTGTNLLTHSSVEGIVTNTRDITDRKQAEISLRESEKRYRHIIETAAEGIWVIDAHDRTSFANDTMAQMLGYTVEEMLGMSMFQFMDQEGQTLANTYIERRHQGIKEQHDFKFCRKDGSDLWAIVSANPIFDQDGQYAGALGMLTDITERKQLEVLLRQTNAELGIKVEERTTELKDAIEELQKEILKRQRMQEALSESEERYRSVVAALQEGIVVHNPDGTIQACNASAERILGLSAAQLIGRSVVDSRWRTIYEDGSRFPGEVHPAMVSLQTGKPCSNVVMGVYKPNGKLTWIAINSQPLLNIGETQPYAVVVSFSDITARKHAEEELRTTQAKLQHLLTSSPAVIYSCTPSGNFDFLFISENITTELGYEPRQFLEEPRFWFDHVHPEDLPQLLADWSNLLEEGYRIHEYRFRHQDGTYHWLHDELRVLKDEAGNPIEVVGSWFDVSGFKWAEKALRDTLQRLTFHVENSPLAVIEWDRDFRVSLWSREAENIFGWKVSEVIGKHPDSSWQFVFTDDVEEVNRVMGQLFNGSEQRSVSYNRNYRADGSIVHCEWYNSVLFDEAGNFVSLLSLVHNITERKLAEEALAKRERYLATLVEIQRRLLMLESDEDLCTLVLEPLGQSSSASRVYVFENHQGTTGCLLMSLRAEWCAEGIPLRINDPSFQNLPYEDFSPQLAKLLAKGEIIAGIVTEFPESERLLLETQGILSILILPLMVNGKFFGFIGFDNCTEARTWEASEVDLLRAAAAAISLAQERQQAESALKASERRYRELVETSQDMIWSVNAQGRYTFVNQAVKHIYGYEPEEMIGCLFTDFMPSEQVPLDLQVFDRLLAGEPCFQYETIHLRKNGTLVQLSFNAIVLRDEQGNALGTTGTARDITEQKRAEEELRRQSLRSLLLADITLKIRQSLQLEKILQTTVREVRELLRADRVLIYRILPDNTGHVVTEAVVPDWFPLLGKTFSAEVFPVEYHALYCQGQTQTIEDLHHAELTPCHAELLHQLEVKAKLVVPIVHKQTLWGLIIAHNRQPRQWSSFEVELLQQLANQVSIALAQSLLLEAVRESEQRFRTMADSAPVLLWVSDADQRRTFFNQSWLTFTGRALEREIGHGWTENVYPADLEPYLQSYATAFEARENFKIEYRLKRVDGEYRWVLDTGTPRFMPDGSFAGYIGSCMDITELKQAEEDIRKTLQKEKELSELKSRFVSMTSHEFRTPLSIILSSAELLEHYGHRWSEGEKLEQLQRIQSAVSDMTQLLNDVLLIGKAEAGKLEFNPVNLELINLCQELIEEVKLSTGNQHNLQFIHPVPSLNAVLDKKLLRQILGNLLSNAIKYSSQGGEIQLELWYEKDQLHFQIRDHGIGIPPEDQPRLFESFHRAANVGTIPGTGLGLAIVKKCVDLHGGHISVNSEVGIGTTFTFTLSSQITSD